jgi:hypothetical protein
MQSTDIQDQIEDLFSNKSVGDVIILYEANGRDYFISSHTDKKIIFSKLLDSAMVYKELIDGDS